ncbi:MAG: ribonuclease III [Maricaulis sp.]|jgi:ribonuclease-3|nr:ribonuclease III [Maricaulis sp.]
MSDLDDVQARLGHEFSDEALLQQAMTHTSFHEGQRREDSYERLEFLGDRVLGLLAAQRLYTEMTEATEGELAPRFNALVSRDACAEVARRFDLGGAILMSPSEDAVGGRKKGSILGNVMEAVMAAVYLDAGLEAARRVFDRGWGPDIEEIGRPPKNPKSELQEWAARKNVIPRYDLTERSGPDHRPVFTITVTLDGFEPAIGEGSSKQAAERAAAEVFIKRENVRGR